MSATAQAPPGIGILLARVGERIADYYKRAQSVVCTEKTTVQPVGRDYAPLGFARVTEYELRVEADNENGEGADAKVVQELLRVNGRRRATRTRKDRAGCTDSNPLSNEPLAFLLPSHRSEHIVRLGRVRRGEDRNTVIIEFTSTKAGGQGRARGRSARTPGLLHVVAAGGGQGARVARFGDATRSCASSSAWRAWPT